MKDKKLIKQIKRGDEKALEEIIITYTAYVSTIVSNVLGELSDKLTVEDITSEVFFSLWKNCFDLKTQNLKSWIGSVARNKAKNHLRSKKVIPAEIDDVIICSDENVFDKLENEEQQKIISDALLQMKESEREIIIRYYFYGQSVRQISDSLGENFETVKSRLSRGRSKLKAILIKGGYFN